MPHLTNGQVWLGFGILFAGIGIMVFAFLVHWRKIDNDILQEDRERLRRECNEYKRKMNAYAEKKAEEMFRQYVKNMRLSVPIRLVNESSIYGGEKRRDTETEKS